MATSVVFHGEAKFKDAVLFTGLPGIGLVGKIAVDYLLKQVKAKRVAEILSDSFPPSVQTKAGMIEMVKDELYYAQHKGRDFLFLAGPVQPPLDMHGPAPEHYEFARTVLEELRRRGLSEVYTLAGINVGERRMSHQPRAVVAAIDTGTMQAWKKLGAVSDRPDGLITGAAGLLLGFARERGLKGACLMGETNARLIYGDHGAAKKLLELMIKRFGFEIDMSGIEHEAKEIEETFKQLSKQFEEPEQVPDSGLSYVR